MSASSSSARLQSLGAVEVGATVVAKRLTAASTADGPRQDSSQTLPTPTTPDKHFAAASLWIMARRTKRLSEHDWCRAVFFTMITIPTLVAMFWGLIITFEETITTQRTLRSRITNDTPISGFYGPGAWWAWLVTLGMAHGHMGVAFVMKSDLSAEWDYDLIAASGYIIAASIDLILKSRAITQLGEGASGSPLICAERVVVIGTGSSLFSVVTSLFGQYPGVHRAGTAAFSFVLALVTSFFALRAHEAISHAMPIIWCPLHDGAEPRNVEIHFASIDFPAVVLTTQVPIRQFYSSRDYWISIGGLSAVVAVLAPVASLLRRHNLFHVLRSVGYAFAFFGFMAAAPLLALVALPIFGGAKWLCTWVTFWVPDLYPRVFPEDGIFPAYWNIHLGDGPACGAPRCRIYSRASELPPYPRSCASPTSFSPLVARTCSTASVTQGSSTYQWSTTTVHLLV
ncbi:hypothetical protein GGX14DRAFT_577556 [Mycena pura]|uniref:Uncharacterized protein n=1 Tax=Mycena pura TaxID=153505 RepID=A0AAD6Y619_9AGAR|nr:hypothetical protein GGX14DRAFT_577556 [Mycena pura]